MHGYLGGEELAYLSHTIKFLEATESDVVIESSDGQNSSEY